MPVMLLLAKASVLLAAALLVALAMRRRPASARHGLWSAAFAVLLALPVLAWALPPLSIDVPAWQREGAPHAAAPSAVPGVPVAGEPAGTASTALRADAVGLDDVTVAPAEPAPAGGWSWPGVLVSVWAAGAIAGLLALGLALARAAKLARRATPLVDAGWSHAAPAASARFGLRRAPRILMSADVVTPMAGGLVRPTVFVPAVARAWDAERRDIVLAHEIAHLAGRDPLRQIVARVALAIYWFHPLAWLAARQADAAREQACDEAVLARGTRPSAYARVLLEFADGLPAAGPAVAALPIVQRSLLEKRLMAILSADTHPRARRRVLLPVLATGLLALPLAAAHPQGATAGPSPAARNLDAPAPMAPPASAPAAAREPEAAGEPASVAPVPEPQATASSCWWKDGNGSTFQGTITISGDEITQRTGRMGGTRVMQQTFGNTRVCMLAEGVGDREGGPSSWIPAAARVIVETVQGRQSRRLVIEGSRLSWAVNGAERAPDAETAAWRARVLAVLDPAWEITMLRGEESSLRGEISSIYGERSSLQGQISSERGEISSLMASRYDASDAERARIAERVKRHEAEIARLEKQAREFDVEKRVAEIERRLQSFDADRRAAAVEQRLRAFDVDAKVKAVEARLARLDVEDKVAAIERRIQALDADSRVARLQERLDRAVRDLHR